MREGYERNMRCDKCKYCRDVCIPPGVRIRGCFCKPYEGKWVTEIEKCPNKAESEK